MVDAAIILIVLVLLFFALKGSMKHFRGEGSCCSGSSSLLKTGEKSLDGPVVASRLVTINGMHCENCAERVKRSLDSIEGVSSSVDLKNSTAFVRMDRSVDDVTLRKKIEEAGYTVVSIAQE